MSGAVHIRGALVAALTMLLAVVAGAAASSQAMPRPFLINESASLPRGLYVRQPDGAVAVGAIVALPQPSSARTYLAALDMPADLVLIKRVAAEGGEWVCRRNLSVRTPGRAVDVQLVDRLGRPLPQWRGCRRLAADEVFVLGDTADSFDSRYFGPVQRGEIAGVYRELMSW